MTINDRGGHLFCFFFNLQFREIRREQSENITNYILGTRRLL